MQVYRSQAKAVMVDSKASTKSRTLHTLNVSGNHKKQNASYLLIKN